MNALERIEAYENKTEQSGRLRSVYLIREQCYTKAIVVSVAGENVVKLFGNLYITKYSKAKKAYLVNTKYGRFRY